MPCVHYVPIYQTVDMSISVLISRLVLLECDDKGKVCEWKEVAEEAGASCRLSGWRHFLQLYVL